MAVYGPWFEDTWLIVVHETQIIGKKIFFIDGSTMSAVRIF